MKVDHLEKDSIEIDYWVLNSQNLIEFPVTCKVYSIIKPYKDAKTNMYKTHSKERYMLEESLRNKYLEIARCTGYGDLIHRPIFDIKVDYNYVMPIADKLHFRNEWDVNSHYGTIESMNLDLYVAYREGEGEHISAIKRLIIKSVYGETVQEIEHDD